jgi:hypothetical protein
MSSKWKQRLERFLGTMIISVYGTSVMAAAIHYLREEYIWYSINLLTVFVISWYLANLDSPCSTTENSPKIGFGSSDPNDGTIGYRRLD